jgi:predicted anti-sigma-YlaC factor YlaD
VLRRRQWLRVALLVVGIVQLIIAIPALDGTSIGMAMSAHATHEAAAWNLALAAAFLAAATAPRRAAGLIPILGTFIVTLTVFSIHDIAAGEVTADRMFTHIAAVIGLILLLAADRAERALPPGWHRLASTSDAGKSAGEQPRGLRGVA